MCGQVKNSHDHSSHIFKAEENDLLRLHLLRWKWYVIYIELLGANHHQLSPHPRSHLAVSHSRYLHCLTYYPKGLGVVVES